MHSSIFLLGALASSAFSHNITFSNTTFTAPVKVGAVWPVSYSAGNGQPVALKFGNSTWAFQIVDALKAPGTYNWTVGVPANVVSGQYQLALSQTGAPEAYSPFFNLEVSADYTPIVNPTIVAPFRAAPPPATVTVIYLPYPVNATTVNYIYYDEGCGCHQTSSCPVEAMPTSTYMTLATYYEHECGCTTTVEAPCAETVMPVPPAPVAATNTPMAPTVAPAAPASPATAAPMPAFTGAGSRIVGSGAGLAALAAALVLA